MEKTKLTEPFRTDWINALRSGEYKQTRGEMVSITGGHCCLAVGCRVKGATFEQLDGSLWPPIAFKLGLTESEESELSILNDGKGKTFPEIADYIEQNH